MSNDTGGRWRAAVVAALVTMTLLTAACAGGTSTGAGSSSLTGASALHQEELAVAQCMRSHGVPNFPDPPANGDMSGLNADRLGVSTSVYQSALNRCQYLAPDAGATRSSGQQQQALGKVLQFARCMRSHGMPDFPDPDGTGLRVDPSMTRLPQYQTAYQACKSLLPPDAPVKGASPGSGS